MHIAVYCSASENIAPEHIELAGEVGAAIARRQWSLVWGGGQISMMGAVSKACRELGGETIGVIPQRLADYEFADHQATELHVVDDMRVRKALLDQFADAFITLPGGAGTMEEFFEIWVGRSLGFHKKPVVILDPSGFYQPLRQFLEYLASQNFVRTNQLSDIIWANTVEEALDACINHS